MQQTLRLGRARMQRIHYIIMEHFEKHQGEELPWMSRLSDNEPDVIMDITNMIREPVGVYTWYGRGEWLSISTGKIAQCSKGEYQFVDLRKIQLPIETHGCDLIINELRFRSPKALLEIYVKLIEDIEAVSREYE